MLRTFWLFFAQAVTVCLALLFVVNTLRPDLLPGGRPAASVAKIATPAAAPVAPAAGKLASFSEAAKRAMPAVVNIYTSKEVKAQQRPPFMDDPVFRYFFGGEGEQSQSQKSNNLGSGVIVSEQGYILTNAHVVEAADEIEVALADNRRAKAKVIGTDPETDLAVIKIDLPKLPAIAFGQSEQAQVGDMVLAIGNPFGVGQTVTFGIVSALARSHLGINTFENFIQTDAAINPGNSGGALVDINGHMIGINTAIYSRTPGGASLGIGFAIPAAAAKQVLDQLALVLQRDLIELCEMLVGGRKDQPPQSQHHHRRDRIRIPATASARLFDDPSPTSHTDVSSCSAERSEVDPGTSSTSVLRSSTSWASWSSVQRPWRMSWPCGRSQPA